MASSDVTIPFKAWVTPLENAGLVKLTIPAYHDQPSVQFRLFPEEARQLAAQILAGADAVEEAAK